MSMVWYAGWGMLLCKDTYPTLLDQIVVNTCLSRGRGEDLGLSTRLLYFTFAHAWQPALSSNQALPPETQT